MDFKIEKERIRYGSLNDSSPKRLKAAVAADETDVVNLTSSSTRELSDSEREAYNKTQAVVGDRADLSNVKNTISYLEDAASAVAALAKQQAVLANKAESLPEISAYGSDLEAARQDISDEITRIQTTANDAGISLSTGASLSYNVAATDSYKSVNIAAVSSNATNPRASIATQTSAATSYDILADAALSVGNYQQHINRGAAKAAEFRDSTQSEQIPALQQGQESEDTQRKIRALANSIANTISSASESEVESGRLVDLATKGLTPDKVKSLLE